MYVPHAKYESIEDCIKRNTQSDGVGCLLWTGSLTRGVPRQLFKGKFYSIRTEWWFRNKGERIDQKKHVLMPLCWKPDCLSCLKKFDYKEASLRVVSEEGRSKKAWLAIYIKERETRRAKELLTTATRFIEERAADPPPARRRAKPKRKPPPETPGTAEKARGEEAGPDLATVPDAKLDKLAAIAEDVLIPEFLYTEEACPGHVASEKDATICGRCGFDIKGERMSPEEEAEADVTNAYLNGPGVEVPAPGPGVLTEEAIEEFFRKKREEMDK